MTEGKLRAGPQPLQQVPGLVRADHGRSKLQGSLNTGEVEAVGKQAGAPEEQPAGPAVFDQDLG